MRELRIVVALCILSATPLKAQDYPAAEVYGGYQLLVDEDVFLGDSGGHLNGFAAGAEFNIKSFVGIAGEAGYGRSQFRIADQSFDRNQTVLLIGPRFSHRGRRARVFGHILLGLSREASDNTLGNPERISTNNFAFAIGGGVEISAGNRVSIRPFQFDVIATRHERAAGFEHDHFQLRYTGSVSFKFDSAR